MSKFLSLLAAWTLVLMSSCSGPLEPEEMAPLTSGVMALAVDQHGIYWTSGTSSAALLVREHAATTISMRATSIIWPKDVAIGRDHLFLATARGVLSVPREGGRSISHGDDSHRVAVDEEAVYSIERGGRILRLPLTSSRWRELGSTSWACGLALDQRHVYVTDDVAGTVSRVPKTGGAMTVLARGQRGICDIAADDLALYWTSATAVVRLDKGSGETAVIAAAPRGAANIVLGSASMYWAQDGSLMGAGKSGVPPVSSIVTAAEPQRLALLGNQLYWADLQRRAIMRIEVK